MGYDDDSGEIRVLQVSNISPTATKEQIHQLFSYIGRIEECQVFPSNPNAQASQKLAYIKYDKKNSIETGQHLTNIVFIDRALICVPAPSSPKNDGSQWLFSPINDLREKCEKASKFWLF